MYKYIHITNIEGEHHDQHSETGSRTPGVG